MDEKSSNKLSLDEILSKLENYMGRNLNEEDYKQLNLNIEDVKFNMKSDNDDKNPLPDLGGSLKDSISFDSTPEPQKEEQKSESKDEKHVENVTKSDTAVNIDIPEIIISDNLQDQIKVIDSCAVDYMLQLEPISSRIKKSDDGKKKSKKTNEIEQNVFLYRDETNPLTEKDLTTAVSVAIPTQEESVYQLQPSTDDIIGANIFSAGFIASSTNFPTKERDEEYLAKLKSNVGKTFETYKTIETQTTNKPLVSIDKPTKDTPTKDKPMKDKPTKDTPTKDTPTKDTPTKDYSSLSLFDSFDNTSSTLQQTITQQPTQTYQQPHQSQTYTQQYQSQLQQSTQPYQQQPYIQQYQSQPYIQQYQQPQSQQPQSQPCQSIILNDTVVIGESPLQELNTQSNRQMQSDETQLSVTSSSIESPNLINRAIVELQDVIKQVNERDYKSPKYEKLFRKPEKLDTDTSSKPREEEYVEGH